MEKQNLLKIFGIALLVFILGFLMVNLFLTFAITGASSKESRINAINAEISQSEIEMMKALPECDKVAKSKENKAKLEGEKVELVHGPFADRAVSGF